MPHKAKTSPSWETKEIFSIHVSPTLVERKGEQDLDRERRKMPTIRNQARN